MADDNKKLEIELSLKTEKFKEQLKEQTRDAKGAASTMGRMDAVRDKLQTNALKLKDKISGPKANKAEIDAAKMMNKFEKKKLGIIEDQIKAVKKLNAEIAKGAKGGAKGAGGGGGGGGKGGGMGALAVGGPIAKVAQMAAKLATATVGAYVGAMADQIKEGYGKYSQYRQAAGGLTGTGATMEGLDVSRRRGVARGYTPVDTALQAKGVAQQTGNARAVTTAQDLSRTIGMDMGSASGVMGQLARGGGKFDQNRKTGGNKQLEKAIAAGFVSGLDRARMPEFIQGVGKLVEMQGGRQGGDVGSGGFATMLAAMGMTGKSGMQGSRGANVLSQLNESMVKPGGGDAGQALMLQAYGFGKPGGNTGYYDALKRQETGASSVENVKALFSETESQYGGGQEQILALREMTGLSITQLEGLRDGIDNLDDGALKEAIEKSKPIDEQSLTQMKEMGAHLARIATLDNRLTELGTLFSEEIEDLQDVINTAIDKGVPYAKATAEAASTVVDLMMEAMGIDKDADKEYSQGAVNAMRSKHDSAEAALSRGEITPEEYEKIALKELGKAQSAQSSSTSTREAQLKAEDTAVHIQRAMNAGPGGPGGTRAYASIMSGKAGDNFGSGPQAKRMQGMLEQYRFQSEVAGNSKDGGKDDAEVKASLNAGGEFHELLRYVMQTLDKTSSTLSKAAQQSVDDDTRRKVMEAEAQTYSNDGT